MLLGLGIDRAEKLHGERTSGNSVSATIDRDIQGEHAENWDYGLWIFLASAVVLVTILLAASAMRSLGIISGVVSMAIGVEYPADSGEIQDILFGFTMIELVLMLVLFVVGIIVGLRGEEEGPDSKPLYEATAKASYVVVAAYVVSLLLLRWDAAISLAIYLLFIGIPILLWREAFRDHRIEKFQNLTMACLSLISILLAIVFFAPTVDAVELLSVSLAPDKIVDDSAFLGSDTVVNQFSIADDSEWERLPDGSVVKMGQSR